MKTTIRFYSGLDTIGALVMEVRYGNDRIFMEAGTAYNPSFDMFDSKVDKRDSFVSDYLWVNELPLIDGIYRKEDLQHFHLPLMSAEQYSGKQAFFITHLHLDHMRMMGMIDSSIPVYLSKPAQIIEKALEDIGEGVDTITDRTYTDFPEDVQVGKIHLHRFTLNDDSYQDYSFYVETPDLKLHYTGDIFVYGKYFNNIQNEIAYINNKDIDLLIHEGTTFYAGINPDIYKDKKLVPTYTPDYMIDKDELDQRLTQIIKNHTGLVLFNIYNREMSDVMDMNDYGISTGRTVVYEPESAYIINQFFHTSVHFIVPDTYKEEPAYLKSVRENNTEIQKREIFKHPEQYMVQNSYPNILECFDYRNCDVLYLHHSGTPLGAFDSKYKTLKNIISELNFKYQNRTDFADGKIFSPHALKEQLLAYVEQVNCRLLVPSHSANRKALIANLNKPYYYAELNKTYIYDREANTLKVKDDE